MPSEFYLLLRMIAPVIAFLCFVPYLVSRFQARDDVVYTTLMKKLDRDVYHLSKDVEVRTKEQTAEIPYVLVSKYGIFVIQVKPFVGTIEGQANHVMWINKRYGKPHRFPNPLSHNREAIRVIRSCYDYSDSVYHSLTIFKGKGKFLGNMPNNVRHQHDFMEYIKSKDNELLTQEEADRIYHEIDSGQIPNTLKTYSQYLDHAKGLVKKYTKPDSPSNLQESDETPEDVPAQ